MPLAALALTLALSAPPATVEVLFLGDTAGHQPRARFRQLEPVFAKRNIKLTYTDDLKALSADNLKKYPALLIYANHPTIAPDQEKALLDYVEQGGGLVPVHCASFCFQNSPKFIALLGAQFRSHETGVFRTTIVDGAHPVMRGFPGYESWDETYVHHKHNTKGRTVLETRSDRSIDEPWTWVRTQGKGRVFYTAWGHDQRTWSHPGFHALLERGTRWAMGGDPAQSAPYSDAPKMTAIKGQESAFQYVPAKVPFYPSGEKWGTTAEPIAKMPVALPPEKSADFYTVPEGFKLELFAADADFQGGKPIATAWDDKGRLWAAVTVDYPNEMQKAGQGRDRIVCLEDTNGDGRADKFTVFAEGLSIPTSLTFAHGGVVVHQAPDTLYLKDTDGDGKADLRQTLITGWNTRDTHAGPSNLRYGFDGHYTGMCGYAGFNGTVNGERVRFGQGFYRLKLARVDGDAHKLKCEKLEFLRSTNNNSWGVGFTEDGRLVGSTANGCPVVHLTIPNRYYELTAGLSPGPLPNVALNNAYHPATTKVRQVDFHGGFTSAAGCGVYTSRTYPKEYWNKAAFVSDPTGHLSAAFILAPAGADIVARYGWNIAAAADEWAAPIDAQVGPDGQVWVLDWYNYIVQHNPTPSGFETGKGAAYETPLRDKKHGRVWRVVHAAGTPDKAPDLSTTAARVAALKHPSLGWRLHAQRLLAESGDEAATAALGALAADKSVDELGLNPGALHAVWTLAHIGGPAAVPAAAKEHAAPSVRRAALLAGAPAGVVTLDPDATVRVAQLLRLADIPASGEAAAALAGQVSTPAGWRQDFSLTDAGERDAWVIAAAAHFAPLTAALSASKTAPPGDIVRAIGDAARAAAARDPATVDRVLAAGLPAPLVQPVAAGFALGLPASKKQKFTKPGESGFVKLLAGGTPASRGALLRLAGKYDLAGLEAQLTGVVNNLLATAGDDKVDAAGRSSAALLAVELRPDDAAVATKVADLLAPTTRTDVAVGLLTALSQSRADAAGKAVIGKLKTLPPGARSAAVRMILARPGSTAALLDAVETGSARFDLLALDQKTALARHPDSTIAARAQKLLAQGGGLPDADRQKVIDASKPQLARAGDAANGKKVYATHCAKCHKHGSEGGNVGPDLTGMASHPKEELLITILDPSRSVEGNFRTYTASTLDGRVVTGLLASETRTAVELVDAEGKKVGFQRDDLESLAESPKSLMPEGFEKSMSPTDLGDVIEFLTQKGKYLPLSLDKAATVNTTRGMFYDPDDKLERLVLPDYKPRTVGAVPFVLVDPANDRPNAVMLYGPTGYQAPNMPKTVDLPVNAPAKAIHLLGGVGGWAFPATPRGTTSLTVRLHYAGGAREDHALKNGVHLADYIRRVDVPGSTFAFDAGGRQVRTVVVTPKKPDVIERIELVKGLDATAPVVLAVTVETP